jgi:IclR family KDG regulon transcriptional repressor
MSIKYQAPSVRKAFEILRLISGANHGMGISELAKGLGISKSTVHGITSVLEDLRAVRRDPVTKRYSLGFTLFELGRLAYSQVDLRGLARPAIEGLRERTRTSVFLGVLNWEHVTILDVVESRQELKITSPVGTNMPIFAGAVGKVFLAWLEEDEARNMIWSKGLTRYTVNTITNPAQYIEELRRVQEQGYATDDEEYILGVRAVASPIKGEKNLMSAIWAVGFKASLDDDKMKELIADTTRTAEAISRKIEQRAVS